MSGSLSLAQSWIRSTDQMNMRSAGGQASADGELQLRERDVTCEEVLLCIDEVIRGFVHLDFTLPGLGHVPDTRITADYMELNG